MGFDPTRLSSFLSICIGGRRIGRSFIATQAWNLASTAERKVAGFSGTNDNKLLLPLQVRCETHTLSCARLFDDDDVDILGGGTDAPSRV